VKQMTAFTRPSITVKLYS